MGASFREVAGNSRERVTGIARGMEEAGFVDYRALIPYDRLTERAARLQPRAGA